MNRVIKFRGKRVDDGEWVEGYYSFRFNQHRIQVVYGDDLNGENTFLLEVIPSTVGQFTGLLDKDGKEIYEGDILGGYPHGNSTVIWDEIYGCWTSTQDLIGNEVLDMPERTVIGNIHDNPELLK